MNGVAAYGIQVVSGTEILLEKVIFRSTQDNLNLTEPKDSPGESMGGFEGLRPPAYTKHTVFDKILLSNVVCMALRPLVSEPPHESILH